MKEEISKRNIIKQSHSLILSEYELSEVTLNLIFTLLTEIKKETENLTEIEIKIADIHKKMGFEIKRDQYNKIAKELMSNPIKIIEKDETINYYNWCSRFSVNTKKGFIKLEIHKDLKIHLTKLTKNFGISYLNEFLKIKGMYSKRLYMIFRKSLKIGKIRLSIKELRSILKIENKFPLYGDIKRRIIIPAINNISKNSTMECSFKEIKKGRKIDSIEFEFYSKERKRKNGVIAIEKWVNK
jgi:plasmid replication initiation protein